MVTVQNGLGAEAIVRRHGDWPLVSGVTFMSGTRHDDTHVEYILDTETWLGPYNGTTYERVEELAGLLRDSGLKARPFEDLRPAQWSKLIFNATVNAVAALTGLPHDAHFAREEHHDDLGHLVHALVDEGKAVAAAAGIELHEDPWEMNVLATRRGSAHYPSMLEDVEARRPTEIELITGALVREAERAARAGTAAHGPPPPDPGEGGFMGRRGRRQPEIRREKGMSGKRLAVVALLAVVLLALALAACGGDDDEGDAAGTTTEADHRGRACGDRPDRDRLGVRRQREHGALRRAGAGGGDDPRRPAERGRWCRGPRARDRDAATRRTTTRRRPRPARWSCSRRAPRSCSSPATSTSRRPSCRRRSAVGSSRSRRASAPTRWGRSASARRASWRSASGTSRRTRARRWPSSPTRRAGGRPRSPRTPCSSTSRTSSRRSRRASPSSAARSSRARRTPPARTTSARRSAG